jgi:hypothetical protein
VCRRLISIIALCNCMACSKSSDSAASSAVAGDGRLSAAAALKSHSASDLFVESFVEPTDVTFGALSSGAIAAYVASGEPFDKAGGYGIQSLAASFVERLSGCYYNVVGFPIAAFAKRLARIVDDDERTRTSAAPATATAAVAVSGGTATAVAPAAAVSAGK